MKRLAEIFVVIGAMLPGMADGYSRDIFAQTAFFSCWSKPFRGLGPDCGRYLNAATSEAIIV
jgi:hypothetical protein